MGVCGSPHGKGAGKGVQQREAVVHKEGLTDMRKHIKMCVSVAAAESLGLA